MGSTTCFPGAELGRLQCQHRTGERGKQIRSSLLTINTQGAHSRGERKPAKDNVRVQGWGANLESINRGQETNRVVSIVRLEGGRDMVKEF